VIEHRRWVLAPLCLRPPSSRLSPTAPHSMRVCVLCTCDVVLCVGVAWCLCWVAGRYIKQQDASASSSSDSDSGSGHGITTKSVREHFSQMSMSPTAATESHSQLTAGATASGRSLAGPGTASGRSLAGPGAVAAAKAATASPRTRVDSSAGRSVDTHTPGSTPAAGEEERKGGGGDGTAAAAAEPVSTKDRVRLPPSSLGCGAVELRMSSVHPFVVVVCACV